MVYFRRFQHERWEADLMKKKNRLNLVYKNYLIYEWYCKWPLGKRIIWHLTEQGTLKKSIVCETHVAWSRTWQSLVIVWHTCPALKATSDSSYLFLSINASKAPSETQVVYKELCRMGGPRIILSTAKNGKRNTRWYESKCVT